MDAPSSQETPVVDPPRHLFFSAEDRRQGGNAGLTDKYLPMEKSRRHQMAENVIVTANQLASAVRTLRAFDRTGNADMALDHIEQTFEDLRRFTTLLVNEVTASVDRYGDEVEKRAFEDIAAAREATDAQTPKPGPVINHLRLDGTPGPTPAAVAAQINRSLNVQFGARR